MISQNRQALISLARQKAQKYGLDGDLVCSIIEQESNWDTSAIRFEQGFLAKYITPLMGGMTKTEAYSRAFSWGLMQVMGEKARELGFGGPFLSQLCDPEFGLEYGCKTMSACMARSGNDIDAALLFYNGGGNSHYPQEVKNRIATYNA